MKSPCIGGHCGSSRHARCSSSDMCIVRTSLNLSINSGTALGLLAEHLRCIPVDCPPVQREFRFYERMGAGHSIHPPLWYPHLITLQSQSLRQYLLFTCIFDGAPIIVVGCICGLIDIYHLLCNKFSASQVRLAANSYSIVTERYVVLKF